MWFETVNIQFDGYYFANKDAVYYTAIKHEGHLKTRVFSKFLAFSQMLLHLFHDLDFSRAKHQNALDQSERVHWFGCYIKSDKSWVLDDSERSWGPVYIIIES